MSNNLAFFDKEGNSLNFKYNIENNIYEGDILFHENSTDTFKTSILYTLEKIPAFEFGDKNVGTNKFQLFNEYGFNFYGGVETNFTVDKIEPVNNDPEFYSKWVYSKGIDRSYKKGMVIRFTGDPYAEFNSNAIYSVISTRKDAILILSGMDNNTYTNTYDITVPYSENKLKVISVNAIGIYNYIDENYENQISVWSEPKFYEKLYKGKKIHVINSDKNDGLYEVVDFSIADQKYYETRVSLSDIDSNTLLECEIEIKGDLPMLYQGALSIKNGKIFFTESSYTFRTLKEGMEIRINGSLSDNFLQIGKTPVFNEILGKHTFSIDDIVSYNSYVYRCIQTYTTSNSEEFRYITPEDTTHWVRTDAITLQENITENINFSQVYLIKSTYNYTHPYTGTDVSTLLTFIEKYNQEFSLFGITLEYNEDINAMVSRLDYTGNYIGITFKNGNDIISESIQVYERILEVDSPLTYERNKDFSRNYEKSIAIKNISLFGVKITINGQLYDIETVFAYNTDNTINMKRTVDRTIRSWFSTYKNTLRRLGIFVRIDSSVEGGGYYIDTIKFTSEYPNIPFSVDVNTGSTGIFENYHSRAIFNDIGGYVNFVINGVSYGVDSIIENGIYDIQKTLQAWITQHSPTLAFIGIQTTHFSNVINFITVNDAYINYTVSVGLLNTPGYNNVRIIKTDSGNFGVLLSSNEIIYNEDEILFTDAGFTAGMITSVNYTIYPLMNVEYTITSITNNRVQLSYQGPFWDVNSGLCFISPFVTVAFDDGFERGNCEIVEETYSGEFDPMEFDTSEFNVSMFGNTYDYIIYDADDNMTDMFYYELTKSIIVLAGNKIIFFDAVNATINNTITLPIGSTPSKMVYNPHENVVYAIGSVDTYIVDLSFNDYETVAKTASKIVFNGNNIYILSDDDKVYDIDLNEIEDDIKDICYNAYSDTFIVVKTDDTIKELDDVDIYTGGSGIIEIECDMVEGGIFIHHTNGIDYLTYNGDIEAILTGSATDFNIKFSSYGDVAYINHDTINGSDFIEFNILTKEIKRGQIATTGKMDINNYDNSLYIAEGGKVVVFDLNKSIAYPITVQNIDDLDIVVYNPHRGSVWITSPDDKKIVEVIVLLYDDAITENIADRGDFSGIYDNQYGTLSKGFSGYDYILLATRDFYRTPRENNKGENPVQYYWKWFSNNVPEFFIYDLSGEQLALIEDEYKYNGITPLPFPVLNRQRNRDINKVNSPEHQQTIFDKVEYSLEYKNDDIDILHYTKPLQLNIGFNYREEGPLRSILQLYKKEISQKQTFSNIGIKKENNNIILYLKDSFFEDTGFKKGQNIDIFVLDPSSNKSYNNNGIRLKVDRVYSDEIVCLHTDLNDIITEEEYTGDVKLSIKIVDIEIARFSVYGQSEEEDERFRIELANQGKLIEANDIFIFKDYDIEEGGIDWTFLNKKRKEMLLNKNIIYPYIGAYKSIVNAINFFGYNDLTLSEYYKNIDTESTDFHKLFKMDIPDIFDNSVEGWTENDFINNKLSSGLYEATNEFGLNYNITDWEGNNVLGYTLDEVIIKLQGLKYWLGRNIIPLTHKIKDITGKTNFLNQTHIKQKIYAVNILNINDNITPVVGKLNEAYLMPVNSGSTVYNCVIDFEVLEKGTNYYEIKAPDFFTVYIKTYKTYKEWHTFKNYMKDDKITYYDRTYKSLIDNNAINNPLRFNDAAQWEANLIYKIADVVRYDRDTYSMSKDIELQSDVNPYIDTENWVRVNTWREIDLEPVQSIKEYRAGDNLLPLNFTVDSNLDPFVVIEVISDNGYGAVYNDKKSYEIRGLKDLVEENLYIDKVGPFQPIEKI